MSLTGNKKKKREASHYIFRGKSNKKAKPIKLQFVESFLMLFFGGTLVFLLNKLPADVQLKVFFNQLWVDISQSLVQLVVSLGKIGLSIIVLLLIVFSLFLLLGGLIRIIRLISILAKSKKNLKNDSMT